MSTKLKGPAPGCTETGPVPKRYPRMVSRQNEGNRTVVYSALDTAKRKPVCRCNIADALAVIFATLTLIAAVIAGGIIADAIPAYVFVLALLGVFTCGLVILWRLP